MTPPATTGLHGGRGLVVGIASESSFAGGFARAFAAAGATLAAPRVDARAQPFVCAVTDTPDWPILLACDITGTIVPVDGGQHPMA